MATATQGRLAVAVHDAEPATFERCALIRDWLDDHGVDRVTLLVIPARDMHPFDRRSPELADWLAERHGLGDEIAQHGFHHDRQRHRPGRGEFGGLDAGDTRRAVDAGRRLLHLAGVEPRGFVAPAYAYTPALHAALARSFEWWAALRAVHQRAIADPLAATAVSLGRLVSPLRLVSRMACGGELLRLDIHPTDLQRGRHVAALERLLRGAHGRTAVTYGGLRQTTRQDAVNIV
jgi:predicted deacetylase